MRSTLQSVFLLAAVLTGIVGCGSGESQTQAPARPVTFLVLEESNPGRLTRLTGSVESWKKEMIGFRVDGRVTRVVEPGANVDGQILEDDGSVHSPGTVLAELDTDRYELRLNEASARVELTKANVLEAETDLQQRIPARIAAATSRYEQLNAEYARRRQLVASGAVTMENFQQTEASFKAAEAELAASRAEQATMTAELAALNAQVKEAEQLRKQAEVDLNDCRLFSPFQGQVSKVHAIAGGYLNKGMPVVTVQMTDPVKVEVAVSQETDRRIRFNEVVDVYLEDLKEPVPGIVYLKDTVADAATRTFNITILIRNRQIEVGLPAEYQDKNLPSTTDLFNLESENADDQPPFFVEHRSVHTDDDGNTFVWKAEGLTAGDLRGTFDPVFTVRKVPVKVGDKILPVLQLYRFRDLTDMGGLDPMKDVITGKLPDGVKDGDTVFLTRKEWLLRPGQLVHVELTGESPQAGLYVPRPAVLLNDGKHYVFVVNDADGGRQQAQRVEVRVGELIGDYRRIEAADGGKLGAGTKVILDGAHYLRDGDLVNAFDEIEVSL
jgi:multidrug efflux pump subunit AcrA (membrane-fusion protein)